MVILLWIGLWRLLVLEMINICPECHNVDEYDRDWRYANPYNSTKFCIYCGTALEHYRDGWLNPEWIERQKEKHKEWKKNNL